MRHVECYKRIYVFSCGYVCTVCFSGVNTSFLYIHAICDQTGMGYFTSLYDKRVYHSLFCTASYAIAKQVTVVLLV